MADGIGGELGFLPGDGTMVQSLVPGHGDQRESGSAKARHPGVVGGLRADHREVAPPQLVRQLVDQRKISATRPCSASA